MAEAPLDSSDCLLCSEELKDPVTLGCDHRFCYTCLQEHWAPNRTGDCPKCRRRVSKGLMVEFALQEKRESTQRQTDSSEEQTGGEQEEVRRKLPEDILFVSDKPKVSSQTQASAEDELQSEIQRLVQKKEHSENIKKQYEDMLQHTERQTQRCEDEIRKRFNLLRQILDQEEEQRLYELRQEQEEKTRRIQQKLRDTEAKLASLSDSIKSAEQQLQSQSSAPLTEIRDPLVLTEEPDPPAPGPGLLINEGRVLKNLENSVRDKMRTMMNASLSPEFLLDPNTAHRNLLVSEDLTRVKHTETPDPNVLLNPERFRSYTSVLGSEGFSSGCWSWEVEVGDHPEWTIGLVKESVDRTAELETLPENGFWCLKHHENKYYNITGETLTLRKRPHKITVQLFYGVGQEVSFYDGWCVICSHIDTFTEKLFPYFYVGPKGGAKDIKISNIYSEFLSPSLNVKGHRSVLKPQKGLSRAQSSTISSVFFPYDSFRRSESSSLRDLNRKLQLHQNPQ
ncbi:E3 ubiquitin-protein ligase TRIM39-like [Boleophthalmus pectinirostris]|uniref:E3 ubiquitin-protein ligase TRIM39-like n=1 Tax=Boleophthalmus pectinirostris TaxID=150288 RepID=UPI00242E1305|nr:E3 ubiquitin-protein ligase TRIM39-like [Boleophthalmus pectinirostris]